MKRINIINLLVSLLLVVTIKVIPAMAGASAPRVNNWLCYYGLTFGHEFFTNFDLVVLNGYRHPQLKRTGAKQPLYLGYLSVGEINEGNPYWPKVKGQPFLVKKSELWNSWLVDIRDKKWQDLLFKRFIPKILKNGFDGIFLDTLDSIISLETLTGKEKNKFKGSIEALIKVIKRIKKEYPKIYIIANRGLPILPKIAPEIDYVLVEDLYSYYGGGQKGYIKVDKNTQKILLQQIKDGLKKNKNLQILTLDYADYRQAKLAWQAIKFSRRHGFIPYVSTYDLKEIFYYTTNLQ